jgi:hypothetical protein
MALEDPPQGIDITIEEKNPEDIRDKDWSTMNRLACGRTGLMVRRSRWSLSRVVYDPGKGQFELASEDAKWKYYEDFSFVCFEKICIWWDQKLSQGGDLLVLASIICPTSKLPEQLTNHWPYKLRPCLAIGIAQI